MATVIHLDTHVVAWLYAGLIERIPPAVRTRLETEPLAVSPVVALELEYLYEVRRVNRPSDVVIDRLGRLLGLKVADAPLGGVAEHARALTWTRDPFDRLISAHCLLADVPLLTADQTIRANLPLALWA